MLGRRRESLRDLVRRQHEEFMRYQERREREFKEESKRRDKEMRAEFKRRDEEMREFNREILLRNEKVYTTVIRQLEENTAQIRSSIEETKAQTQALLRLIDRFDESGGAAAA